MSRKFQSEFLTHLERTNQIGSYCAEDCQYIGWLERSLQTTQAEVKTLRSRLLEEIEYGHRSCTEERCFSSGTDCPKSRKEGDQP